jgi:hypothetical protein
MVALGVAAMAKAGHDSDEIVVPHSDGQTGACEPFECGTRIQQVLDSGLFPGAIKIDALELFNNVTQSGEGYIEPAHYEFFLSTTTASAETATVDMTGNEGPDLKKVADFTISDTSHFFTGALRIPLSTAFDYKPRKGNLLLEIRKDQTGNFGDGPIYVDANAHAPGIAVINDEFGIRPQFGITVGFVGRFTGQFTKD